MDLKSRFRVARVSSALLACSALSGCVAENLGDGLDVVNQTDSTLFVSQQPIRANGGRTRLSMTGCNDSGLKASTKDGTVVATLTGDWCAGQTWTITGPGEATLSDE